MMCVDLGGLNELEFPRRASDQKASYESAPKN
jgi:hypothetical protein